MSLTKLQLSGLVNNLFVDTMFKTDPESYFEYALERLNRDRPHINIYNHTIVSGEDNSDTGSIIDLPSDFDIARDKIVGIEDLSDDGISRMAYLDPSSFFLYGESSTSTKIRFYNIFDVGDMIRVNYRSTYVFTDSSSNIPDSLSKPLAYITAFFVIKSVLGKMVLDKKQGGDEIAIIGRIGAMKDLMDGMLAEYMAFVKELQPFPTGVVPETPIAAPTRMVRMVHPGNRV